MISKGIKSLSFYLYVREKKKKVHNEQLKIFPGNITEFPTGVGTGV